MKLDTFLDNLYRFGLGSLFLLLGGIDNLMISLLILMVVDYITGVSAAYYQKVLSSTVGIWGIVKKVLTLSLVVVAVQIDCITGTGDTARTAIIIIIAGNEGLSILENLGRMDIIVPSILKDALKKLKDKEGE